MKKCSSGEKVVFASEKIQKNVMYTKNTRYSKGDSIQYQNVLLPYFFCGGYFTECRETL